MKKILTMLPFLLVGLMSCKKEINDQTNQNDSVLPTHANRDFVNTFYGPEIHLGDGKMRS
jgi:hypothetical protein